MLPKDLNYLAIALGTVANMVLGALWYGPLFGSLWLKTQAKKGRKPEDMTAGPMTYLQTIIAAVVSQLVLAVVVASVGAADALAGALWGGVVWLGVGATALRANGLFEDTPAGSWLLFSTYYLVVYVGFGAVYAVW